ncbi:serine hydrolase [Bacteroidota bacterium]
MKISRIYVALCFVTLNLFSQIEGQINYNSLDNYINETIKEWNIPGLAVAMVKNDSVIYAKGFGVRSINMKNEINENTIFAIASNTKAFSANAMAILVDEELVSWDDKVIKFIPEFKLYDDYVSNEFTIRDLFCHRSGLKTFSGDLIWYASDYSRDEVIEKIQYLEPEYNFRYRFGYSNLMYLVAGEVIELVTNSTWDEFVQTHFINQLNMNRTFTSITQFEGVDNIASPHVIKNGQAIEISYINWDNMGPAGSINSSVSDMAKWIKFQLNDRSINGNKIVSDENNSELTKLHTPQDINWIEKELWPSIHFTGYGMGWKVFDYYGYKIVSHSGGVDGMISQVVLIPEEDFGFVILTNSGESLPYPLMFHIMDEYLGNSHIDYADYFKNYYNQYNKNQSEYFSKLESERDTLILSSIPFEDFCGIYHCDVYGSATVKMFENKLYVMLDHTPIFLGKLTHYKGNRFWIEMEKVPSLSKGFVDFNVNSNNIEMLIDIPNPDFHFTELKFKKTINQ